MSSDGVLVRYGINHRRSPDFAGMTVGEVLSVVTPILNVPPNPTCMVSGERVSGDYRLRAGDTLNLVRESGTKG